jgi:hypothetical protein
VRYTEIINEYQLQRYPMGNNRELLVYENPSPQNLEKILYNKGELRGLIVGNDVVWAKSHDATHGDLAKLYGIPIRDHTLLRLYFFSEDGTPRFDWDSNADALVRNHPIAGKYIDYGKSNWKIYENQVSENRLYSAITLKEIPEKYKSLPVIGRGTTSVVLEKSPNTVLILTRDAMKRDWLTSGLDIADWIDSFDSRHPKYSALSDKPIYVLQMPKLFPLSKENKRKVKKLMDWFHDMRFSRSHNKQPNINDYIDALNDLDLDVASKKTMEQLLDFLSNYYEDQYGWDLGVRNIMQDANGDLVLLDPIVDKEIIDIYYKR